MTADDFNRWWQDFLERWPDMGVWFCEGREPEDQCKILKRWAEAMFDVGLDEALAVNRAMYAGDLEGFTGRWDRDRIPTIIRKHCVARRPVTQVWTGPEDYDREPEREPMNGEGLNGALHQVLAMKARGASAQECDQYLRELFPPDPIDNQRRYKCVQCLDTGRVEVWHPARVKIAVKQSLEAALRCTYKTSSAACPCKAGEVFARRDKAPLLTFDSLKDCLALPGGDVESAAAIAAFESWLRTRRDVSQRKNYEPAFSQYQQEF